MSPSLRRRFLFLLFGLSGFSALIYEVLWTKHLSLTFGTTMHAVSLVAATFMAGLALGSFLVGRLCDRRRNQLLIYALLEAGIALTALAFPLGLRIVEALHILLSQSLPGHNVLTSLVHVALAALLLLPPTILMGGTFPVMCRMFARGRRFSEVGLLYALNTIGAALGAFFTGYYFLSAWGLAATGYLAIGINLGIALASFLMVRRHQLAAAAPSEVGPEIELPAATERADLLRRHLPLLLTVGLVGLLALAYEILWTRVFLLFLGNTSYAFSVILSVYLLCLSIGGAFSARLNRKVSDLRRVLSAEILLMALAILATVPHYDRLASLFLAAHDASGERWWHLSLLSVLIVFLTIGLPTMLSGAILPTAVHLIAPRREHTGEGVGLVVLFNTLGAVIGGLVAGFFMVPLFGLQGSFRALGLLNLALGIVIGLSAWQPLRKMRAATVLGSLGLALFLVPLEWDQKLVNSGVYIYAQNYLQAGGFREVLAKERIIDLIEGAETTVAVYESRDGTIRFFTVNGKTDGGTGRDMATQLLVGHLPMMLHPAPHDTLVIGLGTGITLNGLWGHPTRSIDCVEISPEVARAEKYFREANGNALAQPQVQLHIDDGRNLLLVQDKRYDVIISEPSNPWQSGNANLFTREFFDIAASRLNPDGLFCQWIGLYDITPDNLRMAMRTLLSVFPHALAFRAGTDMVVVAGFEPITFDYARLQQRLQIPAIAQVLHPIGLREPGDIMAENFLCTESGLRAFAGEGRLNTDTTPYLEFSAHTLLGDSTLGTLQMENMRALNQAIARPTLPLSNLGREPEQIVSAFEDLAEAYERRGRMGEAREFLALSRKYAD